MKKKLNKYIKIFLTGCTYGKPSSLVLGQEAMISNV
jgi:hypothetical protein